MGLSKANRVLWPPDTQEGTEVRVRSSHTLAVYMRVVSVYSYIQMESKRSLGINPIVPSTSTTL